MKAPGRPPRRTCIGCRTVRDQEALIRFTSDPGGGLSLSQRRVQGRGAYVCPSLTCFAEACRRKAFSRALRQALTGLTLDATRERFVEELRRRGVKLP